MATEGDAGSLGSTGLAEAVGQAGPHGYARGWLGAIAVVVAGLELGTGWVEPWGLFHDEFYYWAGAQRPGFGYVDHPPLAPWLLAVATALLGEGRLAFSLVPALCGAGTVLATGWLACRLGASSFGQALAGLAVAIAPVYLIFFSFYSVNAIELLLWSLASCVLVELIRSGNERLWIGFGVLAGVALLNKHTFALFAFALALGWMASPLRSQLRRRWIWLGAALAGLVSSPNLVWNFVHDWPSLTFYLGRGAGVLDATFGEAVEIQLAAMNPANLLIWVPGLCFLLFSRAARPYRPLGVAFGILLLLILFSGQRRGDRIAGAYPIVLAAGACVWDRWQPRFCRAVRAALVAFLLAAGLVCVPAVLPLLSPEGIEAYYEAIGEKPEVEVGDVGAGIPLFLTGRLEWDRFAHEVVAAWRSLPAPDRDRAVILTPHWVFAGVIEYYGRHDGIPPVVSPHNAYAFWGHEARDRDVVVSVGVSTAALERYFDETRQLHLFECRHCAIFRPDMPIRVSYGPVRPLPTLIDEWRDYDIMPVAALLE